MAYEQVLTALADPTRRAILEKLRRGPQAVGDLAKEMPISRPAVSQHLRVLREAGLVSDRRAGTRRIYTPSPAGLVELQAYLERFWGEILHSFKAKAEEREE